MAGPSSGDQHAVSRSSMLIIFRNPNQSKGYATSCLGEACFIRVQRFLSQDEMNHLHAKWGFSDPWERFVEQEFICLIILKPRGMHRHTFMAFRLEAIRIEKKRNHVMRHRNSVSIYSGFSQCRLPYLTVLVAIVIPLKLNRDFYDTFESYSKILHSICGFLFMATKANASVCKSVKCIHEEPCA